MTGFRDRRHGARELAAELAKMDLGTAPIIVGLARGGAPVAHEIATELGLPFDILVVRKLGVPFQPELAFGAIASGDFRVINDDVLELAGVSEAMMESVVDRQQRELRRREKLYRGGQQPPRWEGRTVVIVDDGLATGATMSVAVEAIRAQNPEAVIAAVPLGAPRSCAKLDAKVDELVCLQSPDPFYGVGAWYDNFGETTDDEVRRLLQERGRPSPPAQNR